MSEGSTETQRTSKEVEMTPEPSERAAEMDKPSIEVARSHTPGPWLQLSAKYLSIDNGQTPQVFQQATEADERLMLAAPELFAACHDAIELTIRVGDGTHAHSGLAVRVHRALMAAIQKATK